MPTPYESAQLNLQLFDLRREPLLRQARAWFTREFNPATFDELMAAIRGVHNAWFRMVLGYWDMAASLVTTGAIDHAAFLAAHTEIVAAFAKIHPFLSELRTSIGEPEIFSHIEQVVLDMPDALAVMERRRTRLAAAAKARQEKQEARSESLPAKDSQQEALSESLSAKGSQRKTLSKSLSAKDSQQRTLSERLAAKGSQQRTLSERLLAAQRPLLSVSR